MMPAMISQATVVETWAAVGRGSCGGGGGCRTIHTATRTSATSPTIQNA